MVKRVLLASPRGCAGVERAVETVERLLDLHGPPISCASGSSPTRTLSGTWRSAGRSSSRARPRVPEGATIVLSAHGVAPSVYENAGARRLNTIDALSLVTKVHVEARRYAAKRYSIADRPRVTRRWSARPAKTRRDVLIQTIEEMRRRSSSPIRSAWPTSPRRPSRSTRPRRSSRCSAGGSPRSEHRSATTSATRRRTQ